MRPTESGVMFNEGADGILESDNLHNFIVTNVKTRIHTNVRNNMTADLAQQSTLDTTLNV